MKENSINRIEARTEKMMIDSSNVDDFVFLENKRDIRAGTVNKLYTVLNTGKNFETPLMVNRVGKHMRLLDGNHRIEAIKRYLEKYPERKVEAWIFGYDNLNPEEEKEMYTKWNLGMKQTTSDFIKQYWDDIPIVKIIEKSGFPCKVSHTWGTNAIPLRLLLTAAMSKGMASMYSAHGCVGFLERAKKLTGSDYLLLKTFMEDYIAVFGVPNQKSSYYRSTIFMALQTIWYANINTFGRTGIRAAFTRLIGHERVIYYQQFGASREIAENCAFDLVNTLNRGRVKKVFLLNKLPQQQQVAL